MTIKSVSYHKTFNLGNYCSEKLGAEIDLEKNDSVQDAIDYARQLVEENHKRNNPQLDFSDFKSSPIPPSYKAVEPPEWVKNYKSVTTEPLNSNFKEQQIIDNSKPFDLVGAINSCEDLNTLKSYKFLHKQSPEATEAYEKKLNELSNAKA